MNEGSAAGPLGNQFSVIGALDPGAWFIGDSQQGDVRAERIGTAQSAHQMPRIGRARRLGQLAPRLLRLHPCPSQWHQQVLVLESRERQQGVDEIVGEMPVQVRVEQHVFVGEVVPERMLALPEQRPGGRRQTALELGDFVVIGPPQPVQQLRVASVAESLGVERTPDDAPWRSRLRLQHAAHGRRQPGEMAGVVGPAARARKPGQVVERVGDDNGGAAA